MYHLFLDVFEICFETFFIYLTILLYFTFKNTNQQYNQIDYLTF